MSSIQFDAAFDDDDRRRRLFQGEIFVYSPTPETLAFAEHARSLVEKAFAPRNPETAQYDLPVEEYANILTKLKPEFIHHPESKKHIRAVLSRFGCDEWNTHFEVPKLRSSTSDGYLTAGIAYAWHPHRDTWFSAPPCQINWWLPIYEIMPTNCMAFHPGYFATPVKNSSSDFNYYTWNEHHRGKKLATYVNNDPRPLPGPTEPIARGTEERIVVPVGGLIVFSGAQLHSSVPNNSGRTRFSIDFRTVNEHDLRNRHGAANMDSACTGTVLREFRRLGDFAEMQEELVALYEDGTESLGRATYDPNSD